MSNVTDKVVVVTGASSGVGESTAYAIEQPADVEIDEIVIRPSAQDF